MLRLLRYVFLALSVCTAANAGSPVVVASIAPLHSLLANVMSGVGTPVLLMRPGSSPHDYVMRPSEASILAQADLVFWLGESGERVLLKPLSLRSPSRRTVALLDQPSIPKLALRRVGPWSGKAQPAPRNAPNLTDSHIWLDPEIAGEIVRVMVAELSRIDPVHAAKYAENGRNTKARLAGLDQSLHRRLSLVKAVPYIVYHEAFQYFEQRYGLNNVGSVSDSADVQPGARLVRELKKTIAAQQVQCVFIEPQFNASLVRVLVSGTEAKVAVLDPMGAAIKPGPDAYFELLTSLGNSLASCLEGRR